MPLLPPVQPARQQATPLVLAVLAVAAALLGATGCRAPAAASAPPLLTVASPASQPTVPPQHAHPAQSARPARDRRAVADGRVPDGATVLDDRYPGVANLDPRLRAALRTAATAAARDGITFHLNSGWRSSAYQEQLLDEAVTRYGSRAEASRWVATPATSPHVTGDAVDLADLEATTWLARHGARYGLCQIYANEPWHYELRPRAADRGCPARYSDPSQDPRMRR